MSKIDWTKPVRTVGARLPVEIKFTDGRGLYPVAGYVGGGTDLLFWNNAGAPITGEPLHYLENVPEPRVVWLRVFEKSATRDGTECAAPSRALLCLSGNPYRDLRITLTPGEEPQIEEIK